MKTTLLDAHVFLWFVADDPRLPVILKSALEEADRRLLLSVTSAFEIAIKYGLGKLQLDVPIEELLGRQLEINQIELLHLSPAHLASYADLPFPANGHRDPFDRILVAQARSEGITLATVDSAFAQYDVERLR